MGAGMEIVWSGGETRSTAQLTTAQLTMAQVGTAEGGCESKVVPPAAGFRAPTITTHRATPITHLCVPHHTCSWSTGSAAAW